MKTVKPSTNVKYVIECSDGFHWEEECRYDLLNEAIEELGRLRIFLPNAKYRLVRNEWEVIG